MYAPFAKRDGMISVYPVPLLKMKNKNNFYDFQVKNVIKEIR
jgi:hypothetical protein